MIDELHLYRMLGERVRKIREAKMGQRGRMTQAELAELVDLERTSITNIESGNQRIPLHVLFRICEVLKVSVTDALPSILEVQVSANAPLEELSLDFEAMVATPLVKRAVLALLNRGN
jgi:transcriptional regulator with XRE-family HTH domain